MFKNKETSVDTVEEVLVVGTVEEVLVVKRIKVPVHLVICLRLRCLLIFYVRWSGGGRGVEEAAVEVVVEVWW
ncbi:hypothetical protein HanXRQr2_Chr15g0701591 [Helianthus annuus]|uniref:Uncharacterized protein n=1 Tax=Helianthus annuus TaxID=4232 RepID=A0A251SDM4_HELAN|nr:hypothetical protein HanXRQr2_Chr15g0701591 [Helianthus annuus]